MKFKSKSEGHTPSLKIKDRCGDKLHAFSTGSHDEETDYRIILHVNGGPRVGLTRKNARKFAEAILKELDRA